MSHALIVDDNTLNIQVLAGLLSKEGITHTAVKDATQAIATLQVMLKVDVIFVDLEMPKLNGYELLAQLRAVIGHRSPIIAYTVHTSEIDVVRRLGFDGFLGKPLDLDRFTDVIKRILKREPVWELP